MADALRLTVRDDSTYDYRYAQGKNDAWTVRTLREVADQIDAHAHVPDTT